MRSAPLARLILAVVAVGGGVGAAARSGAGGVTLVPPFAVIAASDAPLGMKNKLDDLAHIDPAHPLSGEMGVQTLSLFGREDLIAATSDHYLPHRCAALPGAGDVFEAIVQRARATRIVIVNESHERSEHRGFTADLAARLRPLGYDTLAMETLMNSQAGVPEQYRPPFVTQPQLPYLSDEDGHYLSEAGFGRLGRRAKALGYRLLAYELSDYSGDEKLTQEQRIAKREEAQASSLAAFVRAHPTAKLLVHVGYSHAGEVPTASGEQWMAARLKAKTGIDPLTISQTTCRGSGEAMRLVALPADEPRGTFDLVVDHPTARFVRGRPAWRQRSGDRVVAIPAALRPRGGWRVIEARPVGEPATSVPIDRVAVRESDAVALMLPPGRYAERAIVVATSAK